MSYKQSLKRDKYLEITAHLSLDDKRLPIPLKCILVLTKFFVDNKSIVLGSKLVYNYIIRVLT